MKTHIEARGGIFHGGALDPGKNLQPGRLHFFYQPDLSTSKELIAAAGAGQYDAVIAAATCLPEDTIFPLGGVRISAGEAPSPNGGRTSTPRDPIPLSDTRPRRSSPEPSPQPAPTLRSLTASRLRRLLNPRPMA